MSDRTDPNRNRLIRVNAIKLLLIWKKKFSNPLPFDTMGSGNDPPLVDYGTATTLTYSLHLSINNLIISFSRNCKPGVFPSVGVFSAPYSRGHKRVFECRVWITVFDTYSALFPRNIRRFVINLCVISVP